jgi:DNA polymerase V
VAVPLRRLSIQSRLSIDELVALREPSRWLLRADGNSLQGIGIYDGDVLVVDKALEPMCGDIVVVVICVDFCCKEFRERFGQSPLLIAHNPMNADVELGEWEEIDLWGIVLYNLYRVSQ